MHLPLDGDLALDVPLGVPGWSMQLTTEAALGVGATIEIRPPNAISIKPPTGTLSGKLLGGSS